MSLYLDHFGFAEAPFRITPHTGFFFTGAKRGQTLEALVYAIAEDEGIVKVIGEVGSGKTTLCRMLLVRLPEQIDTLYLANPSLAPQELLANIAAELGLPDEALSGHARMRALQETLIERYAAGRRVVLLIDEAHAMPRESLEEIRLLSNLEADGEKLLQIALFAQPELDERLAAPDLRQLRERITQQFSLMPLQRADVEGYLEFRLRKAGYRGPNPFTDRATTLIAEHSQGLSRRINILADKSLLAAFSEGKHEVDREQVAAAVADAHFAPLTPSRSLHWRPLLTGVIAALGLGIAIGWFAHSAAPSSVPPVASPSLPTATSAVEAPLPSATSLPVVAASSTTAPVAAFAPPSSTVTPRETPQLDRARDALAPWLRSASRDHYFIQLFATDSDKAAEAERFLVRHGHSLDAQLLRAYRSNRSGRDRIGIIFGEFDSRTAAIAAIQSLPASLRALQPYPRLVERLHR